LIFASIDYVWGGGFGATGFGEHSSNTLSTVQTRTCNQRNTYACPLCNLHAVQLSRPSRRVCCLNISVSGAHPASIVCVDQGKSSHLLGKQAAPATQRRPPNAKPKAPGLTSAALLCAAHLQAHQSYHGRDTHRDAGHLCRARGQAGLGAGPAGSAPGSSHQQPRDNSTSCAACNSGQQRAGLLRRTLAEGHDAQPGPVQPLCSPDKWCQGAVCAAGARVTTPCSLLEPVPCLPACPQHNPEKAGLPRCKSCSWVFSC
jgi:hypothetical protein